MEHFQLICDISKIFYGYIPPFISDINFTFTYFKLLSLSCFCFNVAEHLGMTGNIELAYSTKTYSYTTTPNRSFGT